MNINMKKLKKSMKLGGLLGLFLFGTLTVANAQSNRENPIWISKDVQKVANKKALQNEDFRRTNIEAESVSPTWIITKGVKRTGSDEVAKGNVRSEGTPDFVISKGVKRVEKR
jgi:hypothetical protein